MQFNGIIFIFIFLPLFLLLYFGVNKLNITLGKVVLIIASILFYSFGRWNMLIYLGVSIILNYGFAKLIEWNRKTYRVAILLTVLVNVGLLFYFKYFNFAVRNINRIFETDFMYRDIILPLGISFYSFQQIAYVVSVAENKIEKNSIIDYLTYILFFPKLVMGPLMEPDSFIKQVNDENIKNVNFDNLASGLKLFSLGLFKKVFIADTFAKAVSAVFLIVRDPNSTATAMDCILLIIFYSFVIYFDFSGYSDMAVGISSMININLPINFDSPYKALSIRDFWKRWHISLTIFLTNYIYIPLGGSRKGRAFTYVNTMIVFLISGIWHGAGWVYIIWGGVHGMLSCLDRAIEKYEEKIFVPVRWFITFLIVSILWLLFSAESIFEFKEIMLNILYMQNTAISSKIIDSFVIPEIVFLLKIFHLSDLCEKIRGFNMIILTILSFAICLVPENNYRNKANSNAFSLILSITCFVLGVYALNTESVYVYYGF